MAPIIPADESDAELDYSFLSRRTGFLLRLASVMNLSHLAGEMPDKALTSQRMSVLTLVAANPGASQVRIGEALRLSRPAATLAIDFWEERGCMQRRVVPGDRRSRGLFVTPAGEDLVAAFEMQTAEAEKRLREKLESDEVEELRRLLAKFLG
ncbi:MarR family winged helix-turn-helix transcriptional regulator [Aurantiacibacter luteus]|uniref:MarR family winged helix-turn-helix transcriptional regulator n=1 Tax=Aurantiacibacter luteus TaxID=1581420 RepID=UPI00069AA675|nr:MarR family winged helix-turn-helix transcriptional regulator [Aurantiacibacter luteus]